MKQILFEAFKVSEPKFDGQGSDRTLVNIKFKNAAKILKENGMNPETVKTTFIGMLEHKQIPLIVSGDDCFVEPRIGPEFSPKIVATVRNPKVKTDIWASIYIFNNTDGNIGGVQIGPSYGEDYDGPLDWIDPDQ